MRIPTLGFPYRYFKEKRIFRIANKIFLTNELFKFYNINKFKKFAFKFINLGIPILDIKKDYIIENPRKECIIVYTGALSKQYRNPRYMLRLFALIKDVDNWSLHLYGVNSNDIEGEYMDKLKGKLFIYEKVPRAKILEILKDSSLLINIGNTMSNQLPSKLLDYIGFRKPIINIYKNDDDICNEYLENYPIKLFIKEDDNYLEKESKKLLDFIKENKNNVCSFDEVKKHYDKYSIETIVLDIDHHFTINLQ